ncbi:MAG: alpha/beta hydrolase [Hyphomicrobiales bacterium]
MIHLQISALDPRAVALIAALERTGATKGSLEPEQARMHYRLTRKPLTWPVEPVGEALDIRPIEPGVPALKLFRPLRTGAATKTLVFFHGGGWTVGDLSVYEPLCRRLANALKVNVIWVEYRLAPEHPYPAPLDDAVAATRWIIANARFLGLDPQSIGVAGDSAGANLAAATALLLRERGERLANQVLIYPCLDLTLRHHSHEMLGQGYLLTSERYRWYVRNYLDGADAADWRLSPLRAADLSGLPPTIVLHAGFDPLRDEAIEYAQRLREAKVKVAELSHPDMIHGFLNMGAVLPQADVAVAQIKSALQAFEAS